MGDGRAPAVRLGLAVGPTRLTAVEVRRRVPLASRYQHRTWSWSLAPAGRDGSWPALAEALAALRAELGGARVTVGVALLWPFGHTKAIAVPPVRRRELAGLVLRNVRRYFAIGAEPALADARFIGRRTALAVAAQERDLQAVTAAVSAAGFQIAGITTGSVALAEAIRALVPRARHGRVTVAVASPDWEETMQLVGGAPALVQPLPASHQHHTGATGVSIWRTVGSSDEGARTSIAAPALRDLEPPALAAFGAAALADDVPLLLPDDVRRERQARAKRRTYRLSAAAAVTVMLAAGIHLWGMRRELRAVETERRAIAPAVARATASRRAAVSVLSQLETVARLEHSAPRYTEALAALAQALPDSAYLVSFAAQGSTFRLGGVAKATSAVVPALEASPLFAQVALFSPIERDEESGSEQFDLTVALRAPTRRGAAP